MCNGRFRRFKASSGMYSLRGELVDHYTENSICPACGSGIRHRFVFTFLRQIWPTWPAGCRLLHFAPEPALLAFFKKLPGIEYVPCDLHPTPELGIKQIDLSDISYPADSFDRLLCIHVLEHIREDRRAMAEIHRVLTPQGQAIVAVPTYGATTFEDDSLDAAGRERMFGIADHVRLNGLDMRDKLQDAGFHVLLVSTDDVPGRYMNFRESSPHIESDKHLFLCEKLQGRAA
jgi:predicted SAM-dependent methyltransferase